MGPATMTVEKEQRLVQNGFGNVEVEKGKLLETIKKNRTKHVEEYKTACDKFEQAKLAYALEFEAQLEENIKKAKKVLEQKLKKVSKAVAEGEKEHAKKDGIIDLTDINAAVSLILQPKVQLTVKQPVSHEKEYDRVIRNLELSTAEFVILNTTDFNQYILDEWAWKQDFAANLYAMTSGTSMIGNNHYHNSSDGIYNIGSGMNTMAHVGEFTTGKLHTKARS
jgi:hypothetical protein